MRLFTLAAMAVSAAAFGMGAAQPTKASTHKISGPFVHDNLAVYFIHGESAGGPVPLTLAEAIEKSSVLVHETGSVNNLEIENSGTADVFIQAGDIVKGGQQDRVLTVSMILPAKSGRVEIGSFCVEKGRWSKRGNEDVRQFASATEAMPSREAKLAMRAPSAAPSGSDEAAASQRAHMLREETARRQAEVWASVANVQKRLGDKLGAPVAAAASASSLQLSLENDKLKKTRAAYVAGLQDKAGDSDIVGYVMAVNGKINSADQYPSNGLFRKMWPKMLAAGATEAIGEAAKQKSAAVPAAPAVGAVDAFLAQAMTGPADEKATGTLARQELRDSDKALYVEARKADGSWVHRNYLAK